MAAIPPHRRGCRPLCKDRATPRLGTVLTSRPRPCPPILGAGLIPTGRRRIMHLMKSLPMARPGSPADRAPPPRSRAPLSSRAMKRDDAGFTLIEIVCVLAIIALLAGLVLPSIPRATSGPCLEAYAMQAATILTADRNAAIRRHAVVASVLDSGARTIRSGAGAGAFNFRATLFSTRCSLALVTAEQS